MTSASCAGQRGRIVQSVSIDSEADVDASDAAGGLANHPPKGLVFKSKAEFEPLALELDRQRIETWFRERGYYAAVVEDYEIDEGEEGVEISFEVDAGPLATLESIDVEGAPEAPAVDSEALAAIAQLELGEVIEYEKFLEARARMEAKLANEGYAHAKVEAKLEVERDTGRAIAHYFVSPGPVAYFGRVRVEGTGDIPNSFVTNRITWDEGDRFDPLELEQTRARLFQSGLVADVRFDRETEEPTEVVDITVHAARGKSHELRFGAGIGLEPAFYEVRARVAYVHRGFLDPLLTLRLEGKPAYAIFRSGTDVAGFNWEASADLDREDFIFPRLIGSIGAAYEMEQMEGYQISGPTARAGLARKFMDDRLITSLSLHYEHRFFPSILFELTEEQLADVGLTDPLDYAFLAPSITYEGRDDALTPRSGWWANLRLETGYVFSGSSVYMKLSPELRGYVPVGSRVVVAMRGRLGVGLLSQDAIPIPQRYFGGGAESQRGFGRRRLSPMAPTSEGEQLPVGGEGSLETSLEVRVDIARVFGQMLGAVAFVDAGDVVPAFSDLDLGNLHYAVGPGVRLTTPVGVARLDVGFRLNRMGEGDPDPNSLFAIHFSLGEAF